MPTRFQLTLIIIICIHDYLQGQSAQVKMEKGDPIKGEVEWEGGYWFVITFAFFPYTQYIYLPPYSCALTNVPSPTHNRLLPTK